jgi:hypothetical protein
VGTLGQWEYSCDRAATAEAYARIDMGGADQCSCAGCRNFLKARNEVFPERFLALLESLGIDSRKDAEIVYYGPSGQGIYFYGGWFHFVGTLDTTGDFAPVPMGEGFETWLCRAHAPRISPLKDLPVVQLEFAARNVPWHLDEDPG